MSAQKLTNTKYSSRYGDNLYTIGAIVADIDYMFALQNKNTFLSCFGQRLNTHNGLITAFADALNWAASNSTRLNRPELWERKVYLMQFLRLDDGTLPTHPTGPQRAEFWLGHDQEWVVLVDTFGDVIFSKR